jgi:Rod binding domain-containing protein
MSYAAAPVEVKTLNPLATPLQTKQRDAAKHAAEDFESVFIAQMMEPMFQGLKTDGMFGGGPGEAVFRSLMIQEAGKDIAKSGGIGIAPMVYSEMLKVQGLRNDPVPSPLQDEASDLGVLP